MKRHPVVRTFVAGQRMDWQDHAACAGTGAPDLFYPEQGPIVSAVRRLCDRCPVRAQCLDYALGFGPTDQFGVWGGMSANDRIELLLQRRNRERRTS